MIPSRIYLLHDPADRPLGHALLGGEIVGRLGHLLLLLQQDLQLEQAGHSLKEVKLIKTVASK